MKQFYTILLILSLSYTSTLHAQYTHDEYKFLDINNMKIPLFSRGDIFKPGKIGSHVAQMPTGTLTKTMFAQDMWFGGRDQYNELRVTSQRFGKNTLGNLGYALGPVSTSPVSELESKYNHVWKISKTEIETHIAHYTDPSYSIPDDILNWPAHGDTEYGEASNLAPFVDVNSNGIYEPTLGDYPKIKGDQTLFAMFNDVNHDETNSSGQKVYVEVHVMLYAYSNPYLDYLENSFFVHYDIYNRSSNLTYNDFYISQLLSFDLGNGRDDFSGTHVTKNMAYVYNYDNYDEDFENIIGYKNMPPAYGWAILNQNHTSTRKILNLYYDKTGIPSTPQETFNTMKGLFFDGSPMYYGNYGTTYTDEGTTKFIYPGSSNPNFSEHWDQLTAGSTPYYQAMLSSTISYNFGPDDKICLDYAGVFSRDYVSSYQAQLNHLFNDVDGIKAIYEYENFDCSDLVLHIEESKPELLDFFVSDNQLTVIQQKHLNHPIHLHIVNTLGQHIMHETFNTDDYQKQIDITRLPSGVYFIPDYNFKFVKQ